MMLIVRDFSTDCTDKESVTFTPNVEVAALFAVVPEITPVRASNVKPDGRDPEDKAHDE